MVTDDAKESKMRTALFARLKLSKENEKIAEVYLDMDNQEDTQLLTKVKHQVLHRSVYYGGEADYLEWLRKKKRTEELERYMRFLAEVGGSTMWTILIRDHTLGRMADLDKMLPFLKGEHSEEMKTAIRAELCCQALISQHPEEMKILCQMGEENPEMFLHAMDYCYNDCNHNTWTVAGGRGLAKLLLAAVYLYWKEPGTAASGVADELAENLMQAFGNRLEEEDQNHIFRRSEIEFIQEFARTAGKDSPFSQHVLSIYRKKVNIINTSVFAVCAFLALRHSLRFEIIFRLMVAMDSLNDRGWKDCALRTVRGIADEEYFEGCMDEIEDMLPILDEDYILWCLQAGYDRGVRRMAVKCPEGMKEAVQKANSDEYRKLAELLQEANPALYAQMPSYEKMFREKVVGELLKRVYKGNDEMKHYLMGECSVEKLIPNMDEWEFSEYMFPELYERIARLPETGELQLYRRAVVLEALKGRNWFFDKYWVYVGDATDKSEGNVGADGKPESGSKNGTEGSVGMNGSIGTTTIGGKAFTEDTDSGSGSKFYDKRQIRALFRIFEEEELPYWLRISALGGLCDSSLYDKKSKALFLEPCGAVLKDCVDQNRENWDAGMMKVLQGGGVSAQYLCLKVLTQYSGQDVEKFKEMLFSCAETGTEQIHAQLLAICREHREWSEDIVALLTSKKLKARTFAVLVLEEWNSVSYLEEVKAALGREKNKKLASQLQVLAEDLEKARAEEEQPQQSKSEEERLAAEILKGTRKRKVEWVQGMALPEVHRQDGAVVSQEYMLAVLAAYADMESPGMNQEAEKMAEILNARELAAYVYSVYDGWLKAGAEAKKRWVLYVVSIHGGAEIIPVLYEQIKEWSEHSRGAIASDAVRALALNGSSEALLLLDQMSRKFKFRQIKNAAGEALSNAASELGISREELEDNLVTDMGFDGQMERTFDYGPRKFIVRLNQSLELEVYDENGKRFKNLPSPGKQDDSEKANSAVNEFKQLKKQLKTMVASQKIRLEQALSMSRFWQLEKWRELFVKNPIMHQFAVGLIWGVYVDGVLKDTFRYMEDGSFNTVDESEFVFPELGALAVASQAEAGSDGIAQAEVGSEGIAEAGSEGISKAVMSSDDMSVRMVIGLVHPLELSETELAAWKEQLSDYEIIQPFAQLERPVYRAAIEEKEAFAIERFDEKTINGFGLSGKLLGQGWFRGEVLDAGFFYNYYRSDGKFGAELTFSGSSVGFENEEVTVHKLHFYRFDGSARHEFCERSRCKAGEVNPRYFSEILLQIAAAVEPRTREA